MQPLALSLHPSTTVLVDDSESFLRSLAFQFGPERATLGFTDARAAIDWLRSHSPPRVPGLAAHFDSGQCTVSCDVGAIHHAAFDGARFHTPSVLVVDYSMPQMNGLEFCEAIQDLPCKKILFTGAADEKIAIDAFHRGLIDRYFRKGDRDALATLESDIARLEQRFFLDQGKVLRELLSVQFLSFVNSANVVALVDDLRARHGFVEHYVYPDPAGVLLLEANGDASLLVLQTEEGMQAHYEMACDTDAPPALVSALRDRVVVPYFYDGDGMYSRANASDWYRYVQPARVLSGRQTWYWALFKLPARVLAQPVLSWRAHQSGLTPHAAFAAAAV
ncbi:response regulator [Massilia sp. TS11]|uniref:response regulator n=1 Tax=Massilia sp. TS11 TaxID=2908003 RepID=UPI001EDAC6C5|nr:response regulator [Massilia sp. TS11]MCG2582805.1 response regulator [Massilia sp. TS11]